MGRVVVCLTVSLLTGLPCSRGWSEVVSDDFLYQYTTVVSRNGTRVMFEDVGRKESRTATVFGNQVILHVTHGGSQYKLRTGPTYDSDTTVTGAIKAMKFYGDDRMWIVSRAGARYDTAARIALPDGTVERLHYGNHFSISPDGRHVAFGGSLRGQTKTGGDACADCAGARRNFGRCVRYRMSGIGHET